MAARTLANIADVLGCMAGAKGGLRSGPAANKSWAQAFQLLEVNLQLLSGWLVNHYNTSQNANGLSPAPTRLFVRKLNVS